MLREMQVAGLTLDPVNNAPIVLLRDVEDGRVLPIWIGVIEASAIAFELEEVKLTRPMTHDLLQAAIEALGGAVERVCVVDLRDNTYFARVDIRDGDKQVSLDARPSDAIALALRAKAPILCESKVVDAAQSKAPAEASEEPVVAVPQEQAPTSEASESDQGPRPIVDPGSRSWLEVLEELAPEDFGKYKM